MKDKLQIIYKPAIMTLIILVIGYTTIRPERFMKNTYKLIWSHEALNNLKGIIDYLENRWTKIEAQERKLRFIFLYFSFGLQLINNNFG